MARRRGGAGGGVQKAYIALFICQILWLISIHSKLISSSFRSSSQSTIDTAAEAALDGDDVNVIENYSKSLLLIEQQQEEEPPLLLDFNNDEDTNADNDNDNEDEDANEDADADNENTNDNDHTPIYASSEDKVLGLLYPQGLGPGGNRNQAIKFLSFITHAIRKKCDFILLESLQFETFIGGKRTPIPFDLIFDVDFWNSYSYGNGNGTNGNGGQNQELLEETDRIDHLPKLVDYHESSNYTCWLKNN